MSSIVQGIDIPLSQMPAGMTVAPTPGEGYGAGNFGSDFLGSLGNGLLGGVSDIFGGSSSGSSSGGRSTYTNQTKDILNKLIAEAIQAFEPAKSTIS